MDHARRWPGRLPMLGPAFVVATAFIDPGNVATNIVAGSEYGYLLIWVVVTACVMGTVVQYAAAKLGMATGRSLASVARDRYPRPVVYGLWVIAELIIVMTDVAEFIGGALALNILFGVPLIPGAIITAVATIIVLSLRVRGRQIFPAVSTGLLFAVFASYAVLLLGVGVDRTVFGGLVPGFTDPGSIALAAGIVGATVMPHAVFLHSTLSKPVAAADESEQRRPTTTRGLRIDVGTAMTLAGLVNVAILMVGVGIPQQYGTDLDVAADWMSAELGSWVGVLFAAALFAAALASALTGVYSGQTVMQDFLGRRINIWLRRVLTILPSLVIIALVESATQALVWSQIALSIGLPFALVPLMLMTSDRSLMGPLVNSGRLKIIGWAITTLVVALNLALLSGVG